MIVMFVVVMEVEPATVSQSFVSLLTPLFRLFVCTNKGPDASNSHNEEILSHHSLPNNWRHCR